MIQDMIPTSGYLSAQDPRLNFGLGRSDHAGSIEIRWPDRQVEKFENVRGDRFVIYSHRTNATPEASARTHLGELQRSAGE
jgi:ASPIC and UnbV